MSASGRKQPPIGSEFNALSQTLLARKFPPTGKATKTAAPPAQDKEKTPYEAASHLIKNHSC